ncbi:MAG: M23 family metallopeptidase, partial [Polyangiales bacterium]
QPSPTTFAAAVILSVLLTAALSSLLAAGHALPSLSLPFLLTYHLCLGGLHVAHPPAPEALSLTGTLGDGLRALGALLFLPRVDAGLLVLAALLAHSRVATALAAMAWCATRALLPDAGLAVGLNAMLTAVALGGVWFVPSAWSYALAMAGAAVSAAVGAGLARRGVSVLVVPFNLVVPLALLVLRQRVADGRPDAVDFTPGTPEENLAYFRSRAERFGARAGVRLAAPFRGAWRCTQGHDGAHTHKDRWRHALDFEVFDAQGLPFGGDGVSLEDFYCYKLPVLAPAAGVVVRVVDGVADNRVGAVNLDDNWGNAVIVQHAPGVFSCVAHLSPGSIPVREGAHVVAGAVLGLCGNSGRSAVPHLHMQAQASAELGAATIPWSLHDAVRCEGERAALRAVAVPARGETLRPLRCDAGRAALLRVDYGRRWQVTVNDARTETLVADIDLLGRRLLRVEGTDAALYYTHDATGFTALDAVGDPGACVHALRAALSRVPFDDDPALTWRDRIPLRATLPWWALPLFDLLSPFGGPASLEATFTTRRHGAALCVEGAAGATVTTRAWLLPEVGLTRAEVVVRGRRTLVQLRADDTNASTDGGLS